MRKLLSTFCLGFLLLCFSSPLMVTPVLAQQGFADPETNESGASSSASDLDGFLNDKTLDVLENFQEQSGFRSFAGKSNDQSLDKAGLDSISGIIFTVIDIMKYVIGILVVGSVVVSVVRLVAANSEKAEEEYKSVKDNLLYAVLAAIGIISIEFFFNSVFVVGTNNFLSSNAIAQTFAQAASGEILGIARFIQAAIGTIAVLFLVVAGFRLVANASNDEEAVTKLKSQIGYASAGLVLVAVSEFVIGQVLFVNGGQGYDVENAKRLFVSFTNFISGFIALAAFLSFIYGGYLYVVSGVGEDNTEKVKKIFIGGIVGLLVAAGAFAAVNTVIRLDSEEAPNVLQNQLDTLSR
jgi:hypothetical protein